MPEQEQLNHLLARFLRLNDEGKVFMNVIIRQLTYISGPPVTPGGGTSAVREEAYRESEAVSGFGIREGTCGPKQRSAAGR